LIIEANNLTKKYKRYKKQEGLLGSVKGLFHREYEEKCAIENLNFHVQEGEFLGLIGPNGAGKTTLVKMMTGIIAPTSGELQVLGHMPNKLEAAFKQKYAVVMGQKSQLFFELTTQDTLRLFKEIYGIDEQTYQKNVDYFVSMFGVKDLMNVQVRTLSLGERMKMELIVALLHNPKVLFLDEPTIGLDAIAGKQMREFLKEVNEERKTTILLTSHYMEDIKTLCHRSVVINHGGKIYDGATDALFETYQKNKKVIAVFNEPVLLETTSYGAVMLEETPYRKVMEIPKDKSNELLHYVMSLGPKDISIEEEEIGKVVERIYQEGGNQREKISRDC